jgi:hypothetical protein
MRLKCRINGLMPERYDLERRMIGPSIAMFAGAALLVGSDLLMKPVSIILTRFAVLLTALGAAWQLWTVHSYFRPQRSASDRSK